jgi:hypothetical protein
MYRIKAIVMQYDNPVAMAAPSISKWGMSTMFKSTLDMTVTNTSMVCNSGLPH